MRRGISFGALGLVVIAVVALLATGCTRSAVKEKVGESAAAYCAELNMDYKGGSSPGTDSDGDGYYSIDARCQDRDTQKISTLNLECTITWTGMFATGCKQKVVINKSN